MKTCSWCKEQKPIPFRLNENSAVDDHTWFFGEYFFCSLLCLDRWVHQEFKQEAAKYDGPEVHDEQVTDLP